MVPGSEERKIRKIRKIREIREIRVCPERLKSQREDGRSEEPGRKRGPVKTGLARGEAPEVDTA